MKTSSRAKTEIGISITDAPDKTKPRGGAFMMSLMLISMLFVLMFSHPHNNHS